MGVFKSGAACDHRSGTAGLGSGVKSKHTQIIGGERLFFRLNSFAEGNPQVVK